MIRINTSKLLSKTSKLEVIFSDLNRIFWKIYFLIKRFLLIFNRRTLKSIIFICITLVAISWQQNIAVADSQCRSPIHPALKLETDGKTGPFCNLNKTQMVNVYNQHLGLRSGRDLNGAAYGMGEYYANDIQVIPSWVLNPSSHLERCQRWRDHLMNTITKINELTEGAEQPIYTLLIVDNALQNDPGAQRYAPVKGGVSDGCTFPKKDRLPAGAKIRAEKFFGVGDEGIKEAYAWVYGMIESR